jgi:hypothetical protein
MEITQEPAYDPSPAQEHGNLLVLALLAFAVGCRKRLSADPRAVRSLSERRHRLGAWHGDWWLRARYRCFGHRNGIGFLACPKIRARSKGERHPGRRGGPA